MIRLLVMTEDDLPKQSNREHVALHTAATEAPDSDIVALLHEGKFELIKNRFGPTGVLDYEAGGWQRFLHPDVAPRVSE